ncbi:MAG: ATP-binding protein, partial [Thermoflexia bacterium]
MSVFPSYHLSLFVNREADVQLVHRKVSRVLERTPVFSPHTAFHGPRGCGKSWLLLYLKEELARAFANKVFIFFSALDSADPHPAETILRAASAAFGLRLPLYATLDEMSFWLTEHCRQIGCPVVILIDWILSSSSMRI